MTIRKPDGSIYEPLGSIVQFDPENPTHELYNRWDAEIIKIGGSPIFYYEVFIGAKTIDPLYLESKGKIWSQHPTQLFAVYEPIASQGLITNFGVDSPDNMVFYLNYRAVLDTLGHPPVIGSRIFTPHKREHWEIVERKVGAFQKWGEIRIELYCTRFQDDASLGAGRVSQAQPDFEIN